jgi:antitoxin MazE
MRTRLIRIGNSRGIRIPKAFVEAAGLQAALRIRVVDTGLLLERVDDDPRAGWAEAARQLQSRGEGGLLDEPVPTVFDESEWEWE